MLPDVERTALLYKDCFEIEAPLKHVFTNFFKRAGKRNFFDSTVLETIQSDVLDSVRNFNAFEIFAVIKCLIFGSF